MIVGGTVLVAYGGYKVHQMGGVSAVAKNAVQKVNDYKVEQIKNIEQFKSDMTQIRSESKEMRTNLRNEGREARTQMREDLKINLQAAREQSKDRIRQIKEEAKMERDLQGNKTKDSILAKAFEKDLPEYETRLKDIASHPWDFSPAERASALNMVNDTRSDIAKLRGTDAKLVNSQGLLTNPPNGWHIYERNRLAEGATKQEVYNELLRTSGDKMPGYSRVQTAHGFRETINMAEARKAIDSAPKPQKMNLNLGSTTNSVGKSIAAKAKTPAQIVSEYRKEHPNTTLSPSKILKSYSGETAGGAVKKITQSNAIKRTDASNAVKRIIPSNAKKKDSSGASIPELLSSSAQLLSEVNKMQAQNSHNDSGKTSPSKKNLQTFTSTSSSKASKGSSKSTEKKTSNGNTYASKMLKTSKKLSEINQNQQKSLQKTKELDDYTNELLRKMS